MKTLLRDIEKTRAERLQAQMFITKSMADTATPPEPTQSGKHHQYQLIDLAIQVLMLQKEFQKAEIKELNLKNS